LRRQRDERGGAPERNRRLDSDAAAVQIMTVYVSKGLQYPIVYLPFAFNRSVQKRDIVLFHDGQARCLHVGGKDSPDFAGVEALGRKEDAGDASRLTYVALTRAQTQVVAWWSPAYYEPNGGLSRLLRGRRPGESLVPDECEPARISDEDAMDRFREWEALGGPVIEESVVVAAPPLRPAPAPTDIDSRHFHRGIDTGWRRTSYSGLIRAAQTSAAAGVSSEPEVTELDDEAADIALSHAPSGPDLPSPMADLPMGAKFGTLVHAVLETADPLASDLAAELAAQIRKHSAWWPVAVAPEVLAEAMVPMHDTPLGPLAGGLTLRRIGLPDRLRELDFEFPLAGGDLRSAARELGLADVGALVRRHLPADDALA
ncbi:3'-5' exonuclease, partial [Mycobacterium interjectum]